MLTTTKNRIIDNNNNGNLNEHDHYRKGNYNNKYFKKTFLQLRIFMLSLLDVNF